MKKIIQKQLGELLIENKTITPEHLQTALEFQREKGGLIGQILVHLGYATDEEIAMALMSQYGFPYLPLGGYEIDVQIAKLIPYEMAKRCGLVAVDRVGSILTVAMANPLNSQAIEEVEASTGFKVQIFVSTSADVIQALERAYKAA